MMDPDLSLPWLGCRFKSCLFAGMYGKDETEQARSDMVVGCSADLLQALFKITEGTDEQKVILLIGTVIRCKLLTTTK